MKFVWDARKRLENLRKHGIDFADCPKIMQMPDSVTFLDERRIYDEVRFRTFAWLTDQLILIAHTELDDEVRIISARKAKRHEQKTYLNHFGKRS
jgi:uncharacterized protein